MKITQVSLFELSGQWDGPTYPPGDRQATQLDIYPEFNVHVDFSIQPGASRREKYVEIFTDNGLSGVFGPIEDPQVFVIRSILASYLLGRDPLATELLHDQMLRLHRHGRSGFFLTGLSAVDCALWDLRGKYLDQPVYRLLGGPTRPTIPAYASLLGASVDPQHAADTAREYQHMGYTAQKWFFRYGPGDGAVGMEKNLSMAAAVRAAVGDTYPLAFDAYMGWDEPYAIEMGKRLAPIHPMWVEEPVPPERVGSLAKIRAASGVPLATGEHVYTRWQVKELLANHAVDYIQADPDWTGGITEQIKICSLASSYNIPVVAHGHSLLPALHVAAAQSPGVVPMVEYLIQHQESKQFFHKPVYRPVNGSIALPELPGLGLVLDEAKIRDKREIT